MRLALTNATPLRRGRGTFRGLMADSEVHRLVSLGQSSAELAHELRNVLATIAVSAHAAACNPADSPRLLARITKNAELGQRLVEDVMFLASGAPVEREPMRTADVLAAARATLDTTATFEDHVSAEALWVHGSLFPRALHALYANAAAVAGPAGARIVTRVLPANDEIWVEVEDDGPGVPAALRERLFEPFVTARAGGIGLGLALARRIAEAHGGRLTLLSDRSGTTFRIAMPTR